MGGKRPDQYQIDPGEAGATDYKWRHMEQKEHDEQKAELATNQTEPETESDSMIPKHGENPAQAELKRRNAERRVREGGSGQEE